MDKNTSPETWAMSNMNMIIHDMEGQIELGDTFKKPKFREGQPTPDLRPRRGQSHVESGLVDRKRLRCRRVRSLSQRRWLSRPQSGLGLGADHPSQSQTAGTRRRGARHRSGLARFGNANTNKEKDVRRWFVEQDLIEGVIYLPENLFYNTTAPGIILVLNKAKPKERRNKLFLLNATNEFTKGDPKNYLADDAITRIADTFNAWKEVEKYSRIVKREEIAKNDFNISPSRYIHPGEADEYRPIAEVVEELEEIEEERLKRMRR